jgi:Heterokaryon incompatibility protein (HET)
MKLINTETLELHEFYLSKIPPYAILSHTWGHDEVTFQDMASPSRFSKRGYDKIKNTCLLAMEHGLAFAWVDTCCIDKSSSAEFSEAINSMYQWYKNAEVCYVYLEDLRNAEPMEGGLAHCRWLARGWTLQELIAPQTVVFYDREWNRRGSRIDLIDVLSEATGIPSDVLEYGDPSQYSVATRMSWAAKRETTRTEDIAYCLLGIFDVNMPLLYGEGLKAFRRLQDEIIKRTNDLTIFAWHTPAGYDHGFLQLLAPSPAYFANSSGITAFSDDFVDFSLTNKGLLVSGEVTIRAITANSTENSPEVSIYALFLGFQRNPDGSQRNDGGIYLRKVGPKLFYRDGRFPLAGFGRNQVEEIEMLDDPGFYILTDQYATKFDALYPAYRNGAIHIPVNNVFQLSRAVPERLWDVTDRILLKPKPYAFSVYPMAIALAFKGTLERKHVSLVVLCEHQYEGGVPSATIFVREKYERQAALIFKGKYRTESVFWADFIFQAPELRYLRNYVEIPIESEIFTVSVAFEPRVWDADASVLSLKLCVSQRQRSGPLGVD